MSTSSLVGLKNQGATCYLNSLITTLYYTPEFKQEICALTRNEIFNVNGKLSRKNKVLFELFKIFAQFKISNSSINTKSLTDSFGWGKDETSQQHDINDCFNLLLDGLNAVMPPDKKFIDKYYKGKIITVTNCVACENISKHFESFTQINLNLSVNAKNGNIVKFTDIYESLLSLYLNNEKLIAENKYYCVECQEKVIANKCSRIVKLPSILVFNLNRYVFRRGKCVKLNTNYICPTNLDLSMFMEHEYLEIDRNVINAYDMIAIVAHCGVGSTFGHYVSFVRDMDQVEEEKQNDSVKWFQFDDEKVTIETEKKIKSLFISNKAVTPYMIVYRRKFMNNHDSSKITKYVQDAIH